MTHSISHSASLTQQQGCHKVEISVWFRCLGLICDLIDVGFGSVGGSVGLLPGFFYFYFFGVDSRLWVGGGGGGGVKCVQCGDGGDCGC